MRLEALPRDAVENSLKKDLIRPLGNTGASKQISRRERIDEHAAMWIIANRHNRRKKSHPQKIGVVLLAMAQMQVNMQDATEH